LDFILIKLFLINAIVLGGLWWYVGPLSGVVFAKIIMGTWIYCAIVFVTPLLILFFNHKTKAKGMAIFLEKVVNVLIFDLKGIKSTVAIDDIKEITICMSPPVFDKRIDWMMWGIYSYSKFELKDGNIVVVSCLVWDNVEEVLPPSLIRRKKVWFPMM